jgi:hypothetical protein
VPIAFSSNGLASIPLPASVAGFGAERLDGCRSLDLHPLEQSLHQRNSDRAVVKLCFSAPIRSNPASVERQFDPFISIQR